MNARVLLGIPSGGSVKTKTMFSIFQVLFQTTDATIQASGCTLNDSDQLTCPGGFVSGTSGAGAQISDADFRTLCRHAHRLQQSNLADVVTISQWRNGLTNPRRPR
jgi:hypothetical protein